MKLTFIFFISLLFAFPAMSQSGKEAKVWANIDALNNAIFSTKDSLVIFRLVGEQLTYGHSGGNIEGKAAMVHNAVVSPTTYKNITTEKLSLQFVKKVAIARFIYRATSIEKGVEGSLNLGVLQVWAKQGGKWFLQARQAVKVTPK